MPEGAQKLGSEENRRARGAGAVVRTLAKADGKAFLGTECLCCSPSPQFMCGHLTPDVTVLESEAFGR